MTPGITSAIIGIIAITILSAGAGGHKKTSKNSYPKDKIVIVSEDQLPEFSSTSNIVVTDNEYIKDKKNRYDSYFVREIDEKAIYEFIKKHYKRVGDDDRKEISEIIAEKCNNLNIDPKLIAALIARESGFNKNARSSSGAKGLGQMIDATWKQMKVKDPFDIEQNVEGTAKYFKGLLEAWMDYKRSASLALASYKCGYYNVKKNQGKLSNETLNYISDILSHYKRMLNQAQDVLNN